MKTAPDWLNQQHDRADPNPWYSLYMDSVTPLSAEIKQKWLTDSRRPSRQYVLPIIRPLARGMIIFLQLIKSLLPSWRYSKALHRVIVWGLKRFASPEANEFILRHFHLGSEIQQFILDNSGVTLEPLHFMRFQTLDELKDDAFLNHDLNLYNFITELNQQLQAQGRSLSASAQLDFSAITDGELPLAPLPKGRWNKLDIQSAIELYTPVFQFFLSDDDFWRSVNSLQLDETIALYVARLIDDPLPVMLVNNRHPLVPHSTLRAGFRLVLHGLGTEMLHRHLVLLKRESAKSPPAPL